MDTRTREQRLTDLLNWEEKDRPDDIDRILHHRNKVVLGAVLTSLAGLSETRGMHAYFVEGQASALRQHFYVASKLRLASVREEGGSTFETNHHFFFALLSDNAEIISAFANLETPQLIRERDNPLWPRFHVHMLQLALCDEHEALQAKIEKMAKHGKKPWRDLCAKGEDFYSLLLRRDTQGLERLIEQWAIQQEGRAHLQKFLAEGSTLRAKLCWLKGIPVQIKSPWVPMGLMPIEPLPHYDDEYEFLKPGWVPPTQGLMGKLSRWLKPGE